MREEWMREQCLKLVESAIYQMQKKALARKRKTQDDWVGSSPDPVIVRLNHKIGKYEVVQQCLLGEEPMTAIAYKLGWRPPVNGHVCSLLHLEEQASQFIENAYPLDNDEEDDR